MTITWSCNIHMAYMALCTTDVQQKSPPPQPLQTLLLEWNTIQCLFRLNANLLVAKHFSTPISLLPCPLTLISFPHLSIISSLNPRSHFLKVQYFSFTLPPSHFSTCSSLTHSPLPSTSYNCFPPCSLTPCQPSSYSPGWTDSRYWQI